MSAKRNKARDGEHEGALAFTLTSPVDLATLSTHLSEQMGWRKDSGLVAEGNLAEASEDSPATLWVLRSDVDAHAVRRAVTAYQEVEADTSSEDEFSVLAAKAATGEDLTDEEMQTAVRLLLTRGT